MKLAIVFEETGAYQYKKNKEAESGGRSGGEPYQTGLRPGFEEDFRFGDNDPNDYWSGTDCNDCDDPLPLND